MKHHILSKAITAASVFALAAATHGANFVNPTSNGIDELFIGVHATGGTGVGNSVLIDVGSAYSLSQLAAGQTQGLGSIGTDLVNQFGATWFNRTDLLWSAVAAVQNTTAPIGTDPTNTLYGSVSGTGSFPLSTVGYTRAANGAQSTVAGRIITMADGASGSFLTATQGATANIALQTSADGSSWASYMPGGSNVSGLGNLQFGGFGTPSGQAFEQAFGPGTLTSGYEGALDFYRMFKTGVADGDVGNATNGAGSYQFTITIDGSGNLNAAVLAVPEPTSICLLMAGGIMFLGSRRRNSGRGQAVA
jgi:hypothetical protein